VLDELNFWQNKLDILPFRSVTSFYRVPERIMFEDASNFAGASVFLQNINRVSHVMFTDYEQGQSSTYRELRALEHALSYLGNHLAGNWLKYIQIIKMLSVFATGGGGSKKSLLQTLARNIFDLSVQFKILLE
jgi:hypothetical protein